MTMAWACSGQGLDKMSRKQEHTSFCNTVYSASLPPNFCPVCCSYVLNKLLICKPKVVSVICHEWQSSQSLAKEVIIQQV